MEVAFHTSPEALGQAAAKAARRRGDGQAEAQTVAKRRELPDLSEFRAGLEGKPYPGNSVVDLREEERS